MLSAFLSISSFSHAKTPEEYCSITKENLCVNPFGYKLGAFEDVVSYSNCRSECVKNADNYVSEKQLGTKEKVYSGLSWQCVEYARRWWMLELGITFGSIDSANQIFTLREAERIQDGKKILLKAYNNGSQRPPAVGDLLIYAKQENNPSFQYGHVAVVVGVNLNKGYIELAEQNYDNKRWGNPRRYARRISLTLKDGVYTVYDVKTNKFDPYKSYESTNKIIGWVQADF